MTRSTLSDLKSLWAEFNRLRRSDWGSGWADLKCEHKSWVRFGVISDLKSRNLKLNRLGRQNRRDRFAFEMRMGFLQLVVVSADMTGVALRPPGFMSRLKREIIPHAESGTSTPTRVWNADGFNGTAFGGWIHRLSWL